jgi:hypothetical protein
MRHIIFFALVCAVSASVSAQQPQDGPPYQIGVMPPGGPPPRLPNGKPDLSGHWLPNSAGQGVSGRYGVDPLARRQFDPKATPEEPPQLQD